MPGLFAKDKREKKLSKGGSVEGGFTVGFNECTD